MVAQNYCQGIGELLYDSGYCLYNSGVVVKKNFNAFGSPSTNLRATAAPLVRGLTNPNGFGFSDFRTLREHIKASSHPIQRFAIVIFQFPELRRCEAGYFFKLSREVGNTAVAKLKCDLAKT